MDQQQITSASRSGNRIPYIDIAKGCVMVLVVWVHTLSPFWVKPYFVNSFFFFLSGLFFSPKPWREFTAAQWRRLIRPFFVFFIFSIPFQILYWYLTRHTLAGFDWPSTVTCLFTRSAGMMYLFNLPLWFLLALIEVRFAYRAICRLPKAALTVIALACLFSGIWISHNVESYFVMNHAVGPLGYFILGNLYGRPILRRIRERRLLPPIAASTAAVIVGLYILAYLNSSDGLSYFTSPVRCMAEITFTLCCCYLFYRRTHRPHEHAGDASPDTWPRKAAIAIERRLLWIGTNTIPILGLQLLILKPLNKFAYRYPDLLCHWYVGALFVLLTIWLLKLFLTKTKAGRLFVG